MTKIALIVLVFACTYSFVAAELMINELSSKNDEFLESADGEYHDWIELYNSSDTALTLSDLYLTDDIDELDMWEFSVESMPAKSFLILFCSDKDAVIGGEAHTNFKLTSKGETVYLTDGTDILDSMEFGVINEDYSYGRLDEESEIKVNLTYPTPGKSNSLSGTILASKESGYYDAEFDLKLTAAEGVKIYYTTNGDVPTENSDLYNMSVKIADEYEEYEYLDVPTTPNKDASCNHKLWFKVKESLPRCKVISYRAKNHDGQWGRVMSKSYFLHNQHQVPVLSIVTDNNGLFDNDSGVYVPGVSYNESNPCWTGNYYNRNYERHSTFSYFSKGKKIVEENAGLKIHGGATRIAPLKSIKLFARKKYGVNKVKNVFFPEAEVKEFNSLYVITSMSDWHNTLFKDALTMGLVDNFGLEKTYTQPVVVYINGVYWGISDIRNRINDDYLEEKYNIDNDNIDIIRMDLPDRPAHGNYNDFKPIYDFVVNEDMSQNDNYSYIESRLHIRQYIDYYIAEMFFANYDWPGNNFYLWNSNDYDNKYRPIFFDLDGAWENPAYNMFEHVTQIVHENWPNPRIVNIFFIKLLENEKFKNEFIDRCVYHLENSLNKSVILKKIDDFESKYQSEIRNMIKRFNFPKSEEIWTNDVSYYLRNFIENRECYFRKHLSDYFDLDSNILCSETSVNVDFGKPTNIYPNPANDFVSIEIKEPGPLKIVDLNGTIVKSMEFYVPNDKVNIDFLSPGVYFIRANQRLFKFIKITE